MQDRRCLFGDMVDGEMVLNDAGNVAHGCWAEIPEHFSCSSKCSEGHPPVVGYGCEEPMIPNSEVDLIAIKRYLVALSESDFLYAPKTGLELFSKCTEHFRKHFKPVAIASAINEINRHEAGLKIEIGKNDMRGWVYSKLK